MEQIKKLKGEIKRLRQELILKGTSKKRGNDDDYLSDDSELNEEEKAALRMLSPEQRKMLAELEQAGANKSYIKRKIKQ
jgi:hypothetical protein